MRHTREEGVEDDLTELKRKNSRETRFRGKKLKTFDHLPYHKQRKRTNDPDEFMEWKIITTIRIFSGLSKGTRNVCPNEPIDCVLTKSFYPTVGEIPRHLVSVVKWEYGWKGEVPGTVTRS